MKEEIVRPQAEKKKINCKDEFELCYMRHQYFRRVSYNPSQEEMQPFIKIVKKMAYNTFSVYQGLFGLVGLDVEDIINIGRIHLVSFLGLYSLENTPKKYEAFVSVFNKKQNKNPTDTDIMNKDKANFTLFLKQRMEDVVRVCRQKARNIKGYPAEEHFSFYGKNVPPIPNKLLLSGHEKYGFKKVDLATFRSIRKKNSLPAGTTTFKHQDTWYVQVPAEKRALSIDDLSGADIDPRDNLVNMTPEQIFVMREEENFWQGKQEEFNNFSIDKKIKIIENFIESHKSDHLYKEELRTARKILRNFEA